MPLVTSGQNHCPITGMWPARNSDSAAHSISLTFAPAMRIMRVSDRLHGEGSRRADDPGCCER